MGPSGQEEAQGVLSMLAVTSHESRMTLAHVVERKGLVDSTTRRLVADLDWMGLRQTAPLKSRCAKYRNKSE